MPSASTSRSFLFLVYISRISDSLQHHLPPTTLPHEIGLKHKYLFRNAFYSPSVEASLLLLKNPKKRHLFSVKSLRIDTVGGLLTTVLSRTYPPLIPLDIQEMFENPNGKKNSLFFSYRFADEPCMNLRLPLTDRPTDARRNILLVHVHLPVSIMTYQHAHSKALTKSKQTNNEKLFL